MPENIYEKVLNLYKRNLDEGRIFLFENLPKLMRKNPLMRIKNNTYTNVISRWNPFEKGYTRRKEN